MEQIKKSSNRDHPVMTVTVGKASYRVGIHFNEQSKETLEDKLKRLLIMELKDQNCENE